MNLATNTAACEIMGTIANATAVPEEDAWCSERELWSARLRALLSTAMALQHGLPLLHVSAPI